MGRRGILRKAGIGLAVGTIASLGIIPGTAVAGEGCPFQTIVNRSSNGHDGMTYGTVYEDITEVWVFRGSKRLKLQVRNGEDVVYHQRVRAIPSKTSLRVFLGDESTTQLEIDVVARRAGRSPRELTYEYTCQDL